MHFCMFFFFFIKLNYKAVSLDPECLAQTLIQLETFSFTPNGVLVWCKDFGVHAQLLQAVPFSEHVKY